MDEEINKWQDKKVIYILEECTKQSSRDWGVKYSTVFLVGKVVSLRCLGWSVSLIGFAICPGCVRLAIGV